MSDGKYPATTHPNAEWVKEAKEIAKKIVEEQRKVAPAAAAGGAGLTKAVGAATAAEVGGAVAVGAAAGFAIGSLAPVWTSDNPRYQGLGGVGRWWWDAIFGD